MFQRLRTVCLLLLLALPAVTHAQIQRYSDMEVADIQVAVDVAGAQVPDRKAILVQLKTKVGERFSQLDFDEDLKHLSEEYDRVEPEIEVRGGRMYITLRLAPRPKIRSINFEGNGGVAAKKLRKELDIKVGTAYDRHTFNTAFHSLQEYYLKKGFFEAELTYKAVPVPGQNEVDIVVSVKEGRVGSIRSLRFEGFSRSEKSELLNSISSKKYNLFKSWLTHAGTYHEEMLEQDRYVVLDFLHNQGYADADVQLRVEERPRGGLDVTFYAVKGERYALGEITFSGNTLFTDEEIEKVLAVKEGGTYSPEDLRETVKRISTIYGAKGYIDAVVDYEPRLIPEERAYDVHFDIVEGRQCRVGMVRIIGNRATQQRVILHESTVEPGQVFDIRRVEQTEAMLQRMGYFETVNVYAVRSPQEAELGPEYRDVIIEVEEQGTGTFGISGGASTDEKIFYGIELVERNFNWRGLLSLGERGPGALRGGGEFLQLRANFGKRQRSYVLSWTKPFFMDTCWVVGFDLDRTINGLKSDDYYVRKSGFNLRADYPLNNYYRFGGHYRFRYEDVHISDEQPRSPQLEAQARNQGTISAVGFNFTYNSINYWHTRGLQSSFNGEMAAWPGKFHFFSVSFLNAYYHPLPWRWVLKLRGEMRFVQPIMGTQDVDIPLGERLFMGGEGTVRGYHPYSIGPKFVTTTGRVTNDPRGGLSSTLLSAEINRCIIPRLEFFSFIDGGYADATPWTFDTIRWSAGAGLRIEVMQGAPLIIGLGYPLNIKTGNRDDVEHFFFSFGGRF